MCANELSGRAIAAAGKCITYGQVTDVERSTQKD